MATFTVHEPPNPPADRIDRGDSMVFVRDGFSLNAALLTPLWLIGNRHWIALAAYAIGMALLVGALLLLDVNPAWITLWVVAYQLIWGYEADELERGALTRRGFETVGTVSGRTRRECERRFFDGWLPRQPILSAAPPPAPRTPAEPPPAALTPPSAEQKPARRSLLSRLSGVMPAKTT